MIDAAVVTFFIMLFFALVGSFLCFLNYWLDKRDRDFKSPWPVFLTFGIALSIFIFIFTYIQLEFGNG